VATNDFGAAVWNDARNADDCPAIDAYRQSLTTNTPLPTPNPRVDCPERFGNTDIDGARVADPDADLAAQRAGPAKHDTHGGKKHGTKRGTGDRRGH
jgi:hypothetical protein